MTKRILVFRIVAFLLLLFVAVGVFAGSQQLSGDSAQTIINNARYYLNEASGSTSTTFWSDSELLTYLNTGQVDIVARARCLEGSQSISLVADTSEYAISNSYIDAVTVIYTDSSGNKKGLVRKNPQSIGNINDVGEPVYWYEWAGNLGIFPTLSTVTTETVKVYYVSPPTSVAASGTVSVPRIYNRALTLYVAGQALLKEEQYAKSGRIMAEYLSEIERYRQDYVDRPAEPERNVKPVP